MLTIGAVNKGHQIAEISKQGWFGSSKEYQSHQPNRLSRSLRRIEIQPLPWSGGDADVVPVGVLGGDRRRVGSGDAVGILEDGGDPRHAHLAHQDGVHQVQRRKSR